jgi:hypothetical protein
MWLQVADAGRYNLTWEDSTEKEFSRIEIPAFAHKVSFWNNRS